MFILINFYSPVSWLGLMHTGLHFLPLLVKIGLFIYEFLIYMMFFWGSSAV
jgi:hypothetical protein